MKELLLLILCFSLFTFTGCNANPDTLLQNMSPEDAILKDEDKEIEAEISGQSDVDAAEESKWDAQEEAREAEMVYVYICGAVSQPGVYELDAGSRVFQAIELAGGMTSEAADQSINLADSVTDGQMIRIPTEEEVTSGAMNEYMSSWTKETTSDGKININQASIEELTSLSGIGSVKAAAIVAYRESHGDFSKVEEILQVEGIAEGIYEKIKDQISI